MKEGDIWPVTGPDLSGWNPSEPLKAFQAFATSIHEKAKTLLLKDGRHSEMLFFVPLSGRCHIVQWNGADRNVQVSWIRKHIHDHYIYGVVQACESWMHISSGLDDPTSKRLASGEIRVSELPPEQRVEALCVTAQARDGYSHNWVDVIIRNQADGKLSFGECTEFSDVRGRFGDLFK